MHLNKLSSNIQIEFQVLRNVRILKMTLTLVARSSPLMDLLVLALLAQES